MGENGDGLVEEVHEAGFKSVPFILIDLDGELLGAATVTAVGRASLFGEGAEFFIKRFAFFSPRDEDGVSGGVDEAEFFGSGFKRISERPVLAGVARCKAGHPAGDDALVIPLFGFVPSLPDGLLEVGADGGEVKEVGLREIREHLAAGNGGGGGDVAESGRDGVVAGREEIGFSEFSECFESTIPIAAASALANESNPHSAR